MLGCMRGLLAFGLWLLVGACAPDSATLDLTVSPRTVRRNQTATARVFAQTRPEVPGSGIVRFESDVGSLSTPVELELDEFGVAAARFSCREAEVGCSAESMNVTATWIRAPSVSSRVSVPLLSAVDAGPADAGVGAPDAGIPGTPRWMDFPSGFFLDGSSYVLMRRVFEPAGRVHISQYANDIGRLFIYLDPSPTGDVFDYVWDLHVAAPLGEPLRLGRYSGATRFRSATTPGLDLGGEGRRCNRSGGFFEVHELTPAPDGGVLGVTVTFEQWCEGSPFEWVRGWVRWPAALP